MLADHYDDDGAVVPDVDFPAGDVVDDVMPNFNPGIPTSTPAKDSVSDAPGRGFCCNVCQKRFSRKDNLTRHLTIHTGKPHICHACNKSYQSTVQLQMHTEAVHKKITYSCNLCDKSYKYKRSLVLHMPCHTGDKPYTCTLCGKSFITKLALQDHINAHNNVQPYVCQKCCKAFSRKAAHSGHMKICGKESDSVKCMDCHKYFKCMKYLRSHHNTVHNPALAYQCDICGKTYGQRAGLYNHKKKNHWTNVLTYSKLVLHMVYCTCMQSN